MNKNLLYVVCLLFQMQSSFAQNVFGQPNLPPASEPDIQERIPGPGHHGSKIAPTPAAVECRAIPNEFDDIAFGSYRPENSWDATTTRGFDISCSGGESGPIRISVSTSTYTREYAKRAMANTADSSQLLEYQLFIDDFFSTIFGDGTGGSSPIIVPGEESISTHITIYAKLFQGQRVSGGRYEDPIVITLDF